MAYFGYNSMVPQPYQPQTTPYPQGAAYGVGAGANTLVSNLIAAALYEQQKKQEDQQLALGRLGILDKFGPAAFRAPGAQQMFQDAGMSAIDASQIPPSKEEMESQAMQQLWKLHPEYVGLPVPVIVQMMKQKAAENSYQYAARVFNRGGGQDAPQAPMEEYLGIPGSSVGPQGPAEFQPPPVAGAPQGGGRFTRGIEIGADGAKVTLREEPTPVSIEEQRAAEAAVKGFRRQILAESQAGKKIYGLDGQPTDLQGLAAQYRVPVSDLVNAVAADAARMQGHKLPAEAPSMEKIRAEHQRRVSEEQRTKEYALTEKRLAQEARRVDALIAQGNRATQVHNDLLAKQSMDAARDAAKEALRAAKFMYDQNENDIKNNLGKPTPEQEEKRRLLGAAVTDWVTRLQQLVPAENRPAGGGRSTPFQSGAPTGRSGYPSTWFNTKPPATMTPAPESTPQVDVGEEDEY